MFAQGMHASDFLLSINILLSGNNYTKIALLFKFMNMRIVNQTTFFRIQDHFCIDPIKEFWDTKRKEIIRQLQAKQSVVALGKSRFELTLDLTGHLIYVMGKYNHTSMLTFASPT